MGMGFGEANFAALLQGVFDGVEKILVLVQTSGPACQQVKLVGAWLGHHENR